MNPSKVQARKMVLVSAFLLAAIAVYRDRQQGSGATFKALWGVGVVSLILSIVADFVPQIAGPFAVVTVLGSMTSGGDTLIGKMLGTVAATPAAAKPPTSAPAKPVASTQTTTTGGTKP